MKQLTISTDKHWKLWLRLAVTVTAIAAMLTSCVKPYMPVADPKEEEMVFEMPERKYPFCEINFLWVKPHQNLVGAALKMRNSYGDILLSGIDVMEQGDSVFRWFPALVCDTAIYTIELRQASGNPIETMELNLGALSSDDEQVIVTENATYYMQVTWMSDSLDKKDNIIIE